MATLMTVLGPIEAEAMGPTMSHVHLTLDISCWHMPPQDPAERELADGPITLETVGRARRSGLAWRHNLHQDDVDLAITEARAFQAAGGGTIVNMDLDGIGRSPQALRRIAEATGLHVVASTGWYIAGAHPDFVAAASVEELADRMIGEIAEGIGDSGIRAGNIGEIGMSGMPDVPCQEAEEKVLRAAARAQAATGVSLTVHPNAHLRLYGEPCVDHFDHYLRVLEEEGADLGKFYPSHLGLFDVETADRLLRRGVGFVSFDHFGHEELAESIGPGRGFTPDREEVAMVLDLLARGWEDRILIGNEVGWKTCYRSLGGWGYGHVLENILPWLSACGATEAQLHKIMVENPRRLHAVD
jgi:phosphotriesterase-related protein